MGSSPHTRGALPFGSATEKWGGIIPAYAGSTPDCAGSDDLDRDHPRIRGEHRNAADCEWGHRGSSPHTRGARTASSAWLVRLGIIPAYAGSTAWDKAKASYYRDHPRIRGEHFSGRALMNSIVGSSPHTRGAPLMAELEANAVGIIPAYAGSTQAGKSTAESYGDHPRIRGEHSCLRPCRGRRPGSSPHTRGAQQQAAAFAHG